MAGKRTCVKCGDNLSKRNYYDCSRCGTRVCVDCTKTMLLPGGGIDVVDVPCPGCGDKAKLFTHP